MEQGEIDIEKTINHWNSRSDRDFDTMIHLFNTKDYHWSLFIGHLVIERLLKASIVKKHNTHAPFTHDLRRLAIPRFLYIFPIIFLCFSGTNMFLFLLSLK